MGLEYILDLYNITQQDLATELGIVKQNINRWIKGERKIPKKYLDHLSQKFSLQSEYFNMELNKSDELEIKIIKVKNENPPVRINKTYKNEEWGDYECVEETYEKQIQKEIDLLNVEINRQKTLEEILGVINSNVEIIGSNIKEYIDKNRKVCGVFSYIVTILESKKVEAQFLMEVLNAIVLAYEIEEGDDARPIVRHLGMIFRNYEFDKNLKYSVPKYTKEKVEKKYDEIDLEKLNTEDYKKIFINTDGVINVNNRGRLANSIEVTKFTSLIGAVIRGVLVLEDGTFTYKNNNGDKIEYMFLSKDTPKLYTELLNDIDIDIEEITSCSFSNDDKVLMATTRMMMNKEWVYIHNYDINENGEINKSQTMIPRMMLQANLD